eukprot:362967-Chlamydomonas_euryale.AAC.2
MIYFQGWRNVIRYRFPGDEDDTELPVPCSQAELDEVAAWLQHRDEELEEAERAVEYGGPVDMEIASRVERRDEMPGDMDVDEFGNTVYRRDFAGSYANPNDFYDGGVRPRGDRGGRAGRGGRSERSQRPPRGSDDWSAGGTDVGWVDGGDNAWYDSGAAGTGGNDWMDADTGGRGGRTARGGRRAAGTDKWQGGRDEGWYGSAAAAGGADGADQWQGGGDEGWYGSAALVEGAGGAYEGGFDTTGDGFDAVGGSTSRHGVDAGADWSSGGNAVAPAGVGPPHGQHSAAAGEDWGLAGDPWDQGPGDSAGWAGRPSAAEDFSFDGDAPFGDNFPFGDDSQQPSGRSTPGGRGSGRGRSSGRGKGARRKS